MTAAHIIPAGSSTGPYPKVFTQEIDEDDNIVDYIKEVNGTITVAGGTGVGTVTVDIKSEFFAVEGPNSNEQFTVKVTDTDLDILMLELQARSGDFGSARSKALGVPFKNITITITETSGSGGSYKYLVRG